MQGKERMPELTIYGLAGLAAMLVIALYFAYTDESSPVAGEPSSERINDAPLYDSQRIETRTGNPPFQGEIGQQQGTARASWLQTPGSTVAVPGTIYSGNLQSDRGQGEVLHG
jgi:hypothetical protein